MEPFRGEPGDWANFTARTGEIGQDYSLHHEEYGRRGKPLRNKPRKSTEDHQQAVQSRQLRKLQLARGGFGLSKDEHGSERVDEIMVRYHSLPIRLRSNILLQRLICPSIVHGKATANPDVTPTT
jgi:hypothetical protein